MEQALHLVWTAPHPNPRVWKFHFSDQKKTRLHRPTNKTFILCKSDSLHGGVKCMFGQGCLPEHAAPAVGSQHTEVSTSQVWEKSYMQILRNLDFREIPHFLRFAHTISGRFQAPTKRRKKKSTLLSVVGFERPMRWLPITMRFVCSGLVITRNDELDVTSPVGPPLLPLDRPTSLWARKAKK